MRNERPGLLRGRLSTSAGERSRREGDVRPERWPGRDRRVWEKSLCDGDKSGGKRKRAVIFMTALIFVLVPKKRLELLLPNGN